MPTKSIAKAEKAPAKEDIKKTAKAAVAPADETVKKKPGRPPKAAAEGDTPKAAGAKRGRKPKDAAKPGLPGGEDEDRATSKPSSPTPNRWSPKPRP
ncbi:hypothetical protein HK414_17900 [Ramlibacter terrae]|uniref:Histone n=1 Tax=Ramlibacter terrae TaxID=2732511 RepID=A0ABX6P556_9BURK|nr:hypothetical protein HK414_17900 [Ramlibacter terrae]